MAIGLVMQLGLFSNHFDDDRDMKNMSKKKNKNIREKVKKTVCGGLFDSKRCFTCYFKELFFEYLNLFINWIKVT